MQYCESFSVEENARNGHAIPAELVLALIEELKEGCNDADELEHERDMAFKLGKAEGENTGYNTGWEDGYEEGLRRGPF